MIKIEKTPVYFLMLFVFSVLPVANLQAQAEPVWYGVDENNQSVVHLYFFWSEKCPHCLQALPDIVEMDRQYPWLQLHSLELTKNPQHVKTYIDMAALFANDARSVPTFMFCGNLISGYDDKETTGQILRLNLQACYRFVKDANPDNKTVFNLGNNKLNTLDVPFLGEVSAEDFSLPVLTLLIAGMDAFNPCAFFVLLFLLSMMVHAQSRARMALIGGVFVFFSGAIYFLFMAAWLNLFIYLGELRLMTFIAGMVAILIALINIKDYFWFKKGVSLTLSDNAKPKIFERMRNLLRLDSLITVLFATIVLAIVANSYELLCTAGFPMVYTRILTLNALDLESYYLYLLLYNVIYVLPLLTIVVLFTIKLGSRKLSKNEGVILKLLSGVMMLLLGSLLVLSPQLLNNISVATAILVFSILISWGIVKATNIKP